MNILYIIYSFVSLLLTYSLLFLNQWPGSITPDGMSQVSQVLGYEAYENANPLFHTILISGCIKIAGFFSNSLNDGVAIYTYLQLLIAAAVFAYVVVSICRKGAPMRIVLFAHLFFNPMPYSIRIEYVERYFLQFALY